MINFDEIHSEGRVAAWCDDWYGDVVKGCAWTIFALQACMEAIQAAAIESVVSVIDIFVYLTGSLQHHHFGPHEGQQHQISSGSFRLLRLVTV